MGPPGGGPAIPSGIMPAGPGVRTPAVEADLRRPGRHRMGRAGRAGSGEGPSALRAASVRDANPSGPAGPCRWERSPRSASVRDATRPVPNAARERPRSGPGASLHFLDARLLRGLLTEERARACDEVEDELELLLAVAPDQRAERDSEGAEEPFRLARGLPFLGR